MNRNPVAVKVKFRHEAERYSFERSPCDVSKRSVLVTSPEGRPSLAEIAASLGVSVSAVSKVLNRRGDVAAATRERIEEALAAHQYVRRRYTKPAASPAGMIELVVNGLDGSWVASVAAGVETTAYQAGYRVAISVARSRSERGDWVDAVLKSQSQGVVLVGLVDLTSDEHLRLKRARVPYVVIDPLVEPPQGVPSVGISNWTGARDATKHLIDRGHRRIALVTGPPHRLYAAARISGYQSAMAAAGLPTQPEHIRHGAYNRDSAHRLVREILTTTPRPTAVFICSDHMAIGGYDAIAEAGLRIPDDISVVGFDDFPEARWVNPHLTTVRRPLKDMAATATTLLIRLTHGEILDSHRHEVTTTLIERASTRHLTPAEP
jgi:DNA-binding LacI/PurR family transcriptional regulator